jgi:hypothetical protein
MDSWAGSICKGIDLQAETAGKTTTDKHAQDAWYREAMNALLILGTPARQADQGPQPRQAVVPFRAECSG